VTTPTVLQEIPNWYMMEHGRPDRAQGGRAVAASQRKPLPRNRPAAAMYCFMFQSDLIVPDLPAIKAQEIKQIK